MTNSLFVLCSIFLSLYAAGKLAYALGPAGGVGAPGSGNAGVWKPFGSLQGGYKRPISPGGGRPSAPGTSIGELDDEDKDSPQQRPDGTYGGGVKKGSPKQAPGNVGSGELGVQTTVGKMRGCGKASAPIGAVSGIGGGNEDKICLELLCGHQCQYGHVVENGCPTCRCIKLTSEVVANCPDSPIDAMWHIASSNTIGLATKKGIYVIKEDGLTAPTSNTISDHLESGGLCGSTIDAAFTQTLDLVIGKKEYTVYFSGTYYSIYKDTFTHVSGPHSIHSKYEAGRKTPLQLTFPWYVEKIDAALTWKQNVYFFFKYHDTGYYSKFNSNANEMYKEYPRRTMNWWPGLPLEGPDAAYSSPTSRKMYFTTGDDVYITAPGRFRIKDEYPEPVMNNFIRCAEDEDQDEDGE